MVGGKIEAAWVGYHPFAGPVLDREWVERGFAALHEAFPDIRMAEADSIREGNRAAFRWLMSGTHKGEFLGVAPTGERIEAMGMDIVRVVEGKIVEHWGECDVVGMLRQLGVIHPPS